MVRAGPVKNTSDLASRWSRLLLPLVPKRLFILGRIILQDLDRCDVLRQASAMAYVTLLSLVPSLVAVFCVVSLFSPLISGQLSLVDKLRQFILANLATASGESVVRYLDNMLKDLDLAKIGWSSFASVLVTLILLLRQIEEALNKIWLIRRSRNVFARFVYFWTFLTLGLVVLAIAIGASSGFNLGHLLNLDQVVAKNSSFGWLWSLTGATTFFFALFKIVPNCKVSSWTAICGSLVSAIALQLAGRFYGLYVQDAKNYQTLYGALAQLPLFLTWLYICWVVILLGALISWRLQEGFPLAEDEDTFAAKTPIEHWRDVQVRGALPVIAMLAIYKNFDEGDGRGITAQELAHNLDIPMIWVMEAMDVIVGMGYVLGTQTGGLVADQGVGDAFFPRLPADSLKVEKIRADFSQPLIDIMTHWQKAWPLEFDKILRKLFGSVEQTDRPEYATLARILDLIPPLKNM